MKKIIISVFMLFVFAVPSFAINVMFGAKAGYFVWRPYFKDVDAPWAENLKDGEGILYGPVASVVLTDDISVSVAGFFGTQDAMWKQNKEQDNNGRYVTGNYTLEVDRIDIDSALSYRIHPNFKIFAGYKYQSTDTTLYYVECKTDDMNDTNPYVWIEKTKLDAKTHGPAIGVGYSTAIGQSLFVSANLSFLYMFGNIEASQVAYEYENLGGDPLARNEKFFDVRTRTIGLNFEPSIGAKIQDNVITTLGMRYQWLRHEVIDTPGGNAGGSLEKDLNDHLYGVFVSILYMF